MTQFVIYNLDVFAALKQIEADSVDCVITSPPYWGLRDYGVQGQIGLEEHPQEYIDKIVAVFREVKRILKPSGSVWLNLGDTYCGGGVGQKDVGKRVYNPEDFRQIAFKQFNGAWLQPKQKMLMPHRIAIALQDDGWILRNDVVWHKPSHMPSSVRDRLTNSFEYVFHFVKNRKYYYDLDAIREPHKTGLGSQGIVTAKRFGGNSQATSSVSGLGEREIFNNPAGKNPADVWQESNELKEAYSGNPPSNYYRMGENEVGKNPSDFWEINPEPYREAHFACFPTELVRRHLKATCPKQICVKCGKARERIVEIIKENVIVCNARGELRPKSGEDIHKTKSMGYKEKYNAKYETLGFSDCGCNAGWKAGVVLDPFVGSGTTLFVAQEMGLNGIGIDLNPKYVSLMKKRLLGHENQVSLNENKLKIITVDGVQA